eukprot:4543585-Pleurochrysis_carterae.AAC.1
MARAPSRARGASPLRIRAHTLLASLSPTSAASFPSGDENTLSKLGAAAAPRTALWPFGSDLRPVRLPGVTADTGRRA